MPGDDRCRELEHEHHHPTDAGVGGGRRPGQLRFAPALRRPGLGPARPGGGPRRRPRRSGEPGRRDPAGPAAAGGPGRRGVLPVPGVRLAGPDRWPGPDRPDRDGVAAAGRAGQARHRPLRATRSDPHRPGAAHRGRGGGDRPPGRPHRRRAGPGRRCGPAAAAVVRRSVGGPAGRSGVAALRPGRGGLAGAAAGRGRRPGRSVGRPPAGDLPRGPTRGRPRGTGTGGTPDRRCRGRLGGRRPGAAPRAGRPARGRQRKRRRTRGHGRDGVHDLRPDRPAAGRAQPADPPAAAGLLDLGPEPGLPAHDHPGQLHRCGLDLHPLRGRHERRPGAERHRPGSRRHRDQPAAGDDADRDRQPGRALAALAAGPHQGGRRRSMAVGQRDADHLLGDPQHLRAARLHRHLEPGAG